MTDNLFTWLVILLLGWATISQGTAILGLYLQPREFWKAFWFMSGLWGVIDALIVVYSLTQPVPSLEELKSLLQITLVMDVVYLIIAGVLWRLPKVFLRGFGLAVGVQGLFLLLLDSAFWFRCRTLLGS